MTDKGKIVFDVIKEYYHKYKQFPLFNYIAFESGLDINEVRRLISELERDGKVHRSYAKRKINKEELKTNSQKVSDKVESMVKKLPKFKLNMITIFKFITLLIGIGASYLSVYFTFIWLNVVMPSVYAFSLSLFMVGFSIISFESFIIFKQRKKYFLIFLFFVLWFAVFLFSMSSTVAGQYNKLLQKTITEQTDNSGNYNNVLLYTEYNEKVKDLELDLKSVREERAKLQEYLIEIDIKEEKASYDDVNYRIYLKNIRIDDLRWKIDVVKKQKEDLLKSDVKINVVENVSFFDWVSSIINIPSNIIQFWLSIFPAIFIDIISPLSFAIVMFLKDE